jgi:hypothetical protein
MRNCVRLSNITIVAEILDSPDFLSLRDAWAVDISDPRKSGGCLYSFDRGKIHKIPRNKISLF